MRDRAKQAWDTQGAVNLSITLVLVILSIAFAGCNTAPPSLEAGFANGQAAEDIYRVRQLNLPPSRPNTRINEVLAHSDWIRAVAISPDGASVATASDDATVRVWNAQTGRLRGTLTGHEGAVLAVTYSADGRWLATAGMDRTVRVWDAVSRQLKQTLSGHGNSVFGVAFSPDGQWIASASADKSIRLWHVASGEARRALRGHEGAVNALAFSPDGSYLVSGGADGTVRRWANGTGDLLETHRTNAGSVLAVAVHPAGRSYAAAGRDGRLRLFSFRGASSRVQTAETVLSPDLLTSLAFNAEGTLLLVGGEDQQVYSVAVAGGQLGARQPVARHQDKVRGVAVSGDGKLMASVGFDRALRLWSLSGQPAGEFLEVTRQGRLGSVLLPLDARPENTIREAVGALADMHIDLTNQVPPEVPLPILPPAPLLEKDRFEKTSDFLLRVDEEKRKRAELIKTQQAQYRQAVEARNQRLRELQKVAVQRKQEVQDRLSPWAQQAADVLFADAHLMEPDYDADNEEFRGRLVAYGGRYNRPLAIHMPIEVAKRFDQDPSRPAPHLSFALQDDQLKLMTVEQSYGKARYTARLTDKLPPVAPMRVVIADGAGIERLALQNPNLRDTFELKTLQLLEAGSARGETYEDDLPALLARAPASAPNRHRWLVAIGVEEYDNTDPVRFSSRSAQMFVKVGQKVLGVPDENVYAFIGPAATSGAIEDRLRYLLRNVDGDDTIYFYYAGHGIPVKKDGETEGEPYLLPKDKVPDFIGDSDFFRLRNFYKLLSDSKARSVVAVVDACFSGATDGQSVIKGVAAARLKPKQVSFDVNKMAVLSAGSGTQFANWYPDRGHRLFSYFVLREMLSGRSQVSELFDAIKTPVRDASRKLGDSRMQEPTLEGNPKLRLGS